MNLSKPQPKNVVLKTAAGGTGNTKKEEEGSRMESFLRLLTEIDVPLPAQPTPRQLHLGTEKFTRTVHYMGSADFDTHFWNNHQLAQGRFFKHIGGLLRRCKPAQVSTFIWNS
jgi:hypothetical protein